MNLHHHFVQKTPNSPLKSSYQIRSADGDDIIMQPTGSATKTRRVIRAMGMRVPEEMNGSQMSQYTVELEPAE